MRSRCLASVLLLISIAAGASAQNTLTVDQCRDLARQNNVSYRNSLLERDAARQTRRAVLTKYFPTISAGGAIFRTRDYLIDETIPGGNLQVHDGDRAHLPDATQYAYFPGMSLAMMDRGTIGMITAVQPVFAGGRIINANRLAALGSDVADDKVRRAENEVDLSTEQKYWQIITLDEKRETLRRYQTFLDTLTQQVDEAYQAGITLKNDLLKAQTKRSEISVRLSKLENGRALAMMSFCQHLGIPYDSTIVLMADTASPEIPDWLHVDHGEALLHRPEYRLLQESVKAEALQTAIKTGEYLPQAGVGIGGFYTQFDEADGDYNGIVFGTVSVPISAWWEASHTIKERKLQEKIAANSARENQDLLLLQMDKAWRDLMDAEKELRLSEETKRQAEENRKVAADSYHAGIVTLTDLLDAEATRQQAVDQVTEATANYRVKRSTYLQVTGR
ncbi:MAG: TolC family protein [bacterium]|nr:TolC family protein [bacterium]